MSDDDSDLSGGAIVNNIGEEFDVCVIGSGPAGSTAATFIAMAGHRVLLVEKESLPVYKVGESLLPATIHGVCALLGITEELKSSNFVHKLGGTFRWGKNKEPWTFAFSGSSSFQGPTAHAYQVERIKFDAILLNNARRKGVEVRELVRVLDVIVIDARVSGVRLIDRAGNEKIVKTKYVIDASGHTSTIARHAGERIFSELFKNIAVFGYFTNAGRLPAPNAGNIFCAAFEKGWFWYIPLSPSLTSVGAVIGQECSPLLQNGYERALCGLIASCEPISKLLAGSARCSEPPYNEIRVRKDYSYCNTCFWKPGLVLVGDAACFVDPVFSSGVHLATYSALLAARSINTCLGNHLDESKSFSEFEARYKREYKYFYEFLTAFYELDQDTEGYYWKARSLISGDKSAEDAFLTLVGGDASGELQNAVAVASNTRSEIAKSLFPFALTKFTQNKVDDGNFKQTATEFWEELVAEGTQLQIRGTCSKNTQHERPLFAGGLVPSKDGLHWANPTSPARKSFAGSTK